MVNTHTHKHTYTYTFTYDIEIGMDEDVSKLDLIAPRKPEVNPQLTDTQKVRGTWQHAFPSDLLAPPQGGISWEIFPPMPIPGLDMAIDT